MPHDATFSLYTGTPGQTLFATLSLLGTIDPTFKDVGTTFREQSPGWYDCNLVDIPDDGELFFHTGTLGLDTDFTNVTIWGRTLDIFNIATIDQILQSLQDQFGDPPWTVDAAVLAAAFRNQSNASPVAGSVGADIAAAAAGSSLTYAGIWSYVNRTLTSGAGAGSLLITVTVNDGTDPVTGAQVRFQEVGNPTNTQTAPTDIDGHVIMQVDPANYYVAIAKQGLNFVTVTATITDDSPLSYSMTPNAAIVAPVNPDLCTLYGDLFQIDGTPAAGATGTITLVTPGKNDIATSGGAVVRTVFPITADGSGHFEQDVIRTDSISPPGCLYHVIIEDARLNKKLAAASGTVNVTA